MANRAAGWVRAMRDAGRDDKFIVGQLAMLLNQANKQLGKQSQNIYDLRCQLAEQRERTRKAQQVHYEVTGNPLWVDQARVDCGKYEPSKIPGLV